MISSLEALGCPIVLLYGDTLDCPGGFAPYA